jgi:ribosome-binding protein aMBF1 (putative translation factor)
MPSRKKLAEARRRKGLTQGGLAKKLGTTQATISRIERGAATPDAIEAQKLIRILGVTLDDCVRIDPEEPVTDDDVDEADTAATGTES